MTSAPASDLAVKRLRELKAQSGTHSPSIATIRRELPALEISIDACFLSNPHATDLFAERLNADLVQTGRLRTVLESYPPQNGAVASSIAEAIQIAPERIFAANGASEAIQATLHRFAGEVISLPIPTFSQYYEHTLPRTRIEYYQLAKAQEYLLDIDHYLSFIRDRRVDTAVLINPNNPNGGFLSAADLERFVVAAQDLELVILDESFIHFAYEDDSLAPISAAGWVERFPNLVVIKSMSKDFGIAGLRAGFAVMSPERVESLLSTGYLWNVSGLADYFFSLFTEAEFRRAYEAVRKTYIRDTAGFFADLAEIEGIHVYPSKANFALLEVLTGQSSFDIFVGLLRRHGIYARDCADKRGLDGEFIRVASRSSSENGCIVRAARDVLNG